MKARLKSARVDLGVDIENKFSDPTHFKITGYDFSKI
jgi:hypothetical protein